VALLTRLDEGHMQANFQFLGNHVISFCLALLSNCNPISIPAWCAGLLPKIPRAR
jgi:hypothetical protein